MNTPAELILSCFGVAIAWVVVSQILGGIVVAVFRIPIQEENRMTAHFIFSLWPIFLAFLFLAWLKRFGERYAYYYRLRRNKPSDELMDYFGADE